MLLFGHATLVSFATEQFSDSFPINLRKNMTNVEEMSHECQLCMAFIQHFAMKILKPMVRLILNEINKTSILAGAIGNLVG